MQYTANIVPPDPARLPLQFLETADGELLRCVGRSNTNIRRHCLLKKKSEKLKFNASWSLFKRELLILQCIQFMIGQKILKIGLRKAQISLMSATWNLTVKNCPTTTTYEQVVFAAPLERGKTNRQVYRQTDTHRQTKNQIIRQRDIPTNRQIAK